MPDDFTQHAGDTIRSLMKRYATGEKAVLRWRAEIGLGRSSMWEAPADFVQMAPTLSQAALAVHYGRSKAVIKRWCREKGVASLPPAIGARPYIAPGPDTGPALLKEVRDAAWKKRVPLSVFLAPLTTVPAKYAYDLSVTARPSQDKIARIRALTRGEAIAARKVTRAEPPMRRGPDLPAPTVPRDPCFRCGVRGDIGCAHRVQPWGMA